MLALLSSHGPKAGALLLILCLSLSAVGEHDEQDNDLVADLSKGATFQFVIHRDLPAYTFRLAGDSEFKTIDHIEVFRNSETHSVQTLDECKMEEQPPRREKWLKAEDFNFDGYEDLAMLSAWGATGNLSYCIWLFDPVSGQFVYSHNFSDLGRYQLHPASKTITTTSVAGMAGAIHVFCTYQVVDNRPLLVEEERQSWDDEACALLKVIRKRRNGKLVVVTREHVQPDEPWPCQPATTPK